VDGDRPLEFELDIAFSFRNLNSFVDQYPLWSSNILKAFQTKKTQTVSDLRNPN